MQETFSATLPLFALIFCGYIARWRGVMGDGSAKVLNNFVLYFALPALLVRTLAGLPIAALLDARFIVIWVVVGGALFVSVALLAAGTFGQRKPDAVIQAAGASLGNVGFLGLTVVVSLLDREAIAVVSMAIMLDLVLIVPTTVALLDLLGSSQASSLQKTLANVARSLVGNPFVASIFLGLVLSFANLEFPPGVDDFLRTLGMAAVPTALFAIGVTLYGQPISAHWMEVTLLSVLKLVVHPLIILGAAILVPDIPRDIAVAATLLAALPVANNAFVIATRFDVRPSVVSGAILVSTSASLVTFNIWASLLI